MTQLDGKVALVTGGGRGIGAAIARRLAESGATVVVTYGQSGQRAQELIAGIEAAGGTGQAIHADNRDGAAVEAAVDKAIADYGRLDILVNNAGVFQVGPLEELDLEAFDNTMSVNVRAPYAAVRAARTRLSDGGRVIFIGSNLAQRVPGPGIGLYAASKAALVGLAKGLAREFGDRGITVNVVHPGSTDTEMNPASGETADLQRSLMAIPRYNDPADVAGLVAWLAGPDGRSVTGAELTIDGGANA